MRKKRPNLAAASAVHDGEHAHLGVGALRQTHALETRQLRDAGRTESAPRPADASASSRLRAARMRGSICEPSVTVRICPSGA